MSNQKTQTQRLHNSVNHAIIKCRRGTPAGPGPAAPPDDEQYRGRPLPGGASDRGLTLRQGREKAYVFFGEEKSSPILLQIAPPVMLARLGVGFCFADTGRRPLT